MSDDQELNAILENGDCCEENSSPKKVNNWGDCIAQTSTPKGKTGFCQWSTSDGKRFFPSSKTVERLTPGVYDIRVSANSGLWFEKIPVLTTGIVEFPETNSQKVFSEIQKFWARESVFKEYNLTFKRGIFLWGPPGSGKSCTIQLVMRDVVERGGVVIKFCHPGTFTEGIRYFREIQPDTPIVILMEDIDSILEQHCESDVLNILDGVDQIQKAVFLATSNYPEKLGARIVNRPSRFDKRFKIGHPSAASRKIYLEYIIGGAEKVKALNINLEQWVEDTHEFSIAHLKELFTAVVILGDDYNQAISTLKEMKEKKPDSSKDEEKAKLGFATGKKLMGFPPLNGESIPYQGEWDGK